jgi:NAD(P)-dependent dehydrogenase (short-subunit alcohol dehydrogenase family)
MDKIRQPLQAVVTGAAGGIGLALCGRLAQAGAACVTLVDRAEAALEAAAGELRRHWPDTAFQPMAADFSMASARAALIGQLSASPGPLHMLFNNAGVLPRSPVDGPDFMADLQACVEVNLTAVYELTLGLLPRLERARGSVVITASVCSERALDGEGAYCLSKAGVAQLARSLAVELAHRSVRVNAVAPGLVRTPMTSATTSDRARLDRYLARVPLARPAEPEEVADACLFLASSRASFITGALLPVDGGFLCT